METNAQVFKCESCGKECKNAQALRMHLMQEKKKLEKAKIAFNVPQSPSVQVKQPEKVDYMAYKRLPPPVVAHLEKSWGNWLNHFEIKMTDWRQDFGGPVIEIKVPQAFSTEWEELTVVKYDNETRKKISETKVWKPDIRICSLKDVTEAIKWLDKVKEHVVTNAFRRGLILPTTGIRYEAQNKSIEDYKRELAGV